MTLERLVGNKSSDLMYSIRATVMDPVLHNEVVFAKGTANIYDSFSTHNEAAA